MFLLDLVEVSKRIQQFVSREPKLVRVTGNFEKLRVREFGGEIIDPMETMFGSKYQEVRETEGLRNRCLTAEYPSTYLHVIE